MFIQENLLIAQAEMQVEGFRENPTSAMHALVISMVLNTIKLYFGTLQKSVSICLLLFSLAHTSTRTLTLHLKVNIII